LSYNFRKVFISNNPVFKIEEQENGVTWRKISKLFWRGFKNKFLMACATIKCYDPEIKPEFPRPKAA
jgi:hypothetical protein